MYLLTFPVCLSPKRLPMAIIKSAAAMVEFAAFLPCIPAKPKFCGCEIGTAPFPIKVLTTGKLNFSMKAIISFDASAATAPPPTITAGRSAFAISSAASAAQITKSASGLPATFSSTALKL